MANRLSVGSLVLPIRDGCYTHAAFRLAIHHPTSLFLWYDLGKCCAFNRSVDQDRLVGLADTGSKPALCSATSNSLVASGLFTSCRISALGALLDHSHPDLGAHSRFPISLPWLTRRSIQLHLFGVQFWENCRRSYRSAFTLFRMCLLTFWSSPTLWRITRFISFPIF